MDPVPDRLEKNLPAGKLFPEHASPHPPPPPGAHSPSAAPSHTSIDIGASSPTEHNGPNPYAATAPARSTSMKVTMEKMRDVLGSWSKKVGEGKRLAEDLSRNVWQHLKTGPSIAEASMGRIAHSTKVIAEGGHDKIFRQTFDNLPEEQLKHSFACYLSTSAGPVMGTLYISTAKVAFSSDNPLSYKVGKQTEWSYYKVVIPLHQLIAVKSSASDTNPAEKYIQVVSVDNHEFWFMGLVRYDNAVKNLEEVMKDVHELHA